MMAYPCHSQKDREEGLTVYLLLLIRATRANDPAAVSAEVAFHSNPLEVFEIEARISRYYDQWVSDKASCVPSRVPCNAENHLHG
jgi:hypothetical protein